MRKYHKIEVSSSEIETILKGHPWLYKEKYSKFFSNIDKIRTGDIVDIFDSSSNFIARGLYDSDSEILVRIFTYDFNELIDEKFFINRIGKSFQLRKKIINFEETNAFRLVYGESDYLPALVIDCYGDYAVIQFYSHSLFPHRYAIYHALKTVLPNIKGIYQKDRTKGEKEEDRKGYLVEGEEAPNDLIIKENGIYFYANLTIGQKTGLFLDQRENRKTIQKYCKDKNVLNCFSYTGGFSVYAALAGAKKVTSVDLSKKCIESAQENFKLNSLNPQEHEFIAEDVFEFLNKYSGKNYFDIIILDPPAFATSKKHVFNAYHGYKRLNALAINSLKEGGILISSSCSTQLTPELFMKALKDSAKITKREIQVIEMRFQPPDHPINVFFPEGLYLKFFISIIR